MQKTDPETVSPLLSIVVPVKNRQGVLTHTLDSIWNQPVLPQHIIIVDNGSTDSTLDTALKWAREHNHLSDSARISVISESHPGACAARNRGLELVSTDYVMFFDSDDIMEYGHLKHINDYLASHIETELLHWDLTCRDTDGWTSTKRSNADTYHELIREQILHSTLSTPRYCICTAVIKSSGAWNEKLMMWNDYELGIRLLAHNPEIKTARLTNPPTVIHSESVDSLTGPTFSSRAQAHMEAFKSIYDTLSPYPDLTKLLAGKAAVIAGCYRREGSKELAKQTIGWAKEILPRDHHRKLRLIYLTQLILGKGATSLVDKIL